MDALVQIGGLVLVFLAGAGFACYRLKGKRALGTTVKAMIAGGPGVEE